MLKYWVWLATRHGVSRRSLFLLASQFATPQEVYLAEPEVYQKVPGVKNIESLMDKELFEAEKICVSCFNQNIRIITVHDEDYPERLRNIEDPPLVLYCKGTMPDWNLLTIGVVGTRKASAYGSLQARKFGYGLSAGGCVLVSGGAAGVDTQALIGALQGGSPVVAVFGCGVDIIYPKSNHQLFADIVLRGCLLSEFPPGTPPRAENFPVRNRIISGLSAGVVLIEAPEKSGALITARHALEQGRDVFALPANPDSATCQGNLQMIRDGAIVALGVQDIIDEYVFFYPYLQKLEKVVLTEEISQKSLLKKPDKQDPSVEKEKLYQKVVDKATSKGYIDIEHSFVQLSDRERLIVGSLFEGEKHIDEIVAVTSLPTGQVLAALTMLEVKGIVRHLPARMFSLADNK